MTAQIIVNMNGWGRFSHTGIPLKISSSPTEAGMSSLMGGRLGSFTGIRGRAETT